MPKRALHHTLVALILFALWVVFSGKFDAMHLIMGVVCSVFVSAISGDLLYTDHPNSDQRRWLSLLPWGKMALYLPWLLWEIVKANIQVLKLVLGPRRNIRPRVVRFKTGLKHEVAKVVLGNSITLTPGTVTLDIEEDGTYVVHAIDEPSADGLLAGSMQTKVARVFGEQAKP